MNGGLSAAAEEHCAASDAVDVSASSIAAAITADPAAAVESAAAAAAVRSVDDTAVSLLVTGNAVDQGTGTESPVRKIIKVLFHLIPPQSVAHPL
jgi:hypothetical protein